MAWSAADSMLQRKMWVRHHGGEALWAAVFALIFGIPLAIYAAKLFLELPPYKIYLVAGEHYLHKSPTDLRFDTEMQFKAAPELRGLQIGGVPVELEVLKLKDDSRETASAAASDLVSRPDTILVIGHLDSEPTEASLPIYFNSTSPMPFIGSAQTEDDLLEKACGKPRLCLNDSSPLPYLQLSPNNQEQAHWAIQFAIERGKRHFLIVESDSANAGYSQSLASDYKKGIDELVLQHSEIRKYERKADELTRELLGEVLLDNDIDCVLYAGGFDDAPPLLTRIAQIQNAHKHDKAPRSELNNLMAILDDSVVEERLQGAIFALQAVKITNQIDAGDYKHFVSVNGLDAISIAAQIIRDMNTRGLDLSYRLRALFQQQRASDIRRNLVRTMRENFSYRTSYVGTTSVITSSRPRSFYTFGGQYKRSNGFFHIWDRTGVQTLDVDRWHPPTEEAASPHRMESAHLRN